jgi:serine/threonine-protein kinase
VTIVKPLVPHQLPDLELPGRYKLLRHLADGGMASVWCAEDSVLCRKVAIKILSPQLWEDARAVRGFEREARAAARLSGHRNIVTIFDVGEAHLREQSAATGLGFIVMEHLVGGTVADALRVGTVSQDRARIWIREAASALDYAHRNEVVHCDIKPANLLLDSDRVLHIADFGIARIATDDGLAHGSHLFGTADYLSPEQARGAPATAESDLYALAVVAFELLVHERPFDAHGFVNIARCHLDEEPPAASERRRSLPRTLDPVLQRGMAKCPQDRWSSGAALADAIDAAVSRDSAAA